MNRTTAYATAALLTASGLLLGAHAAYPVLDLASTLTSPAQAQSAVGQSAGGQSAGGQSAGGQSAGGTSGSGPGGGATTPRAGTPAPGTTGSTSPTPSSPSGGSLTGNAPNAGSLNTTRPGAGVNPYPGTTLGTTTAPGGAGTATGNNPALTQPRAGEVPPAPGTGVTTDGRPCNRSGTTAPNANLPSC